MNVLLSFGGLERPGGITPDLRNLEQGLAELGVGTETAGSLGQVLAHLRHRDVDVVHVFGCLPSATIFGSILAGRVSGRSVVWTPVFHPGRLGYWRGSGRYRAMAVFDRVAVRAAKLTDALIAATPAEARYFESIGAPHVEVNPPVVRATSDALDGATRSAARRLLGVGDGPVLLLVAAHSARRKGLDVARDALRRIRREFPDANLLLAGGGDPGSLAGEAGVVTTGWLSDEDLDAAYGCADVLLVPSRYEQFSRATLEAWAHELPVVLSDGVGLAQEADGVAGLVVRYGDATATATAVSRLLADAVLARALGRAGRHLAESRYELVRHATQMAQLYGRIRGSAVDEGRQSPSVAVARR